MRFVQYVSPIIQDAVYFSPAPTVFIAFGRLKGTFLQKISICDIAGNASTTEGPQPHGLSRYFLLAGVAYREHWKGLPVSDFL